MFLTLLLFQYLSFVLVYNSCQIVVRGIKTPFCPGQAFYHQWLVYSRVSSLLCVSEKLLTPVTQKKFNSKICGKVQPSVRQSFKVKESASLVKGLVVIKQNSFQGYFLNILQVIYLTFGQTRVPNRNPLLSQRSNFLQIIVQDNGGHVGIRSDDSPKSEQRFTNSYTVFPIM